MYGPLAPPIGGGVIGAVIAVNSFAPASDPSASMFDGLAATGFPSITITTFALLLITAGTSALIHSYRRRRGPRRMRRTAIPLTA